MELIHHVDMEKYERLIDVLCDAGVDEWKAEAAICSYVAYVDRIFDVAAKTDTAPRGLLGNDIRVLTFDEWADVCDAMEPFTSDISERWEQAWRKTSSRWWTAERVILSR